jgi:hypothetical protein
MEDNESIGKNGSLGVKSKNMRRLQTEERT